MRNKHPEIFHPGPQSNRRSRNKSIDSGGSGENAQFPGFTYNHITSTSPGGMAASVEEFDDDDFAMNLLPSAALTSEVKWFKFIYY